MGALSVAAEMAWKVAAAEAARGRHSQIDNALLLVGLCSLEKLLSAEGERALAPEAAEAVRREADRVEAALARAGLEATPLRRLLRDRLGRGTYDHGGRAVSRTPACKETFYRAALLAGGTEVTCLHLLAALAQDPDPAVSRPLREMGASLDTLKEQALLIAREAPVPAGEKGEGTAPRALAPPDAARIVKALLEEFVDTIQRQHGVVLTVEPAAEAFIAQAGFDPARGGARRAVERLVQAPLSNLILEGKIRKHPAWTVAYDEGGVYVIPAPRG